MFDLKCLLLIFFILGADLDAALQEVVDSVEKFKQEVSTAIIKTSTKVSTIKVQSTPLQSSPSPNYERKTQLSSLPR